MAMFFDCLEFVGGVFWKLISPVIFPLASLAFLELATVPVVLTIDGDCYLLRYSLLLLRYLLILLVGQISAMISFRFALSMIWNDFVSVGGFDFALDCIVGKLKLFCRICHCFSCV